ncbi:hypothetical protein B6A10_16105 [Flavobacterium sp. L1I52]|uniref:Uncharacterized protein n=1 Tax=Flavobacterium pokkalii TaxID=1940408 RepID=A0ABR7UYW2_9FLAO|nr:hypothetical protein [Flavobacterium pokkalii]MBD0726695.1 hypothetical protein [Flavobacterium pokkalii]
MVDINNSNYNQTIALHEFFGHGRPLSIQSPGNVHDPGDAIRFENLVWRLIGEPNKQNDGRYHDDNNGVPMTDYTSLPTFR